MVGDGIGDRLGYFYGKTRRKKSVGCLETVWTWFGSKGLLIFFFLIWNRQCRQYCVNITPLGPPSFIHAVQWIRNTLRQYKYHARTIWAVCASSKGGTARGDTIHQLPGRIFFRKKTDEVYIIKEANWRGDNDAPFESTVYRPRNVLYRLCPLSSFIPLFYGPDGIYHAPPWTAPPSESRYLLVEHLIDVSGIGDALT